MKRDNSRCFCSGFGLEAVVFLDFMFSKEAKEAYLHLSIGQYETVKRHKWNLLARPERRLKGQHIPAIFHVCNPRLLSYWIYRICSQKEFK